MKNYNKFIKIVFIFLIVFLMTFSNININANSKIIDALFYGNQTQLFNGQDYKVTLKLVSNNKLGKGLYAYKAKIIYDKNIFEQLEANNFKSLNNWENLQYNEKTGEFVAIKKSGCKNSEEVVQITLKVKDIVESFKTKVEIRDIVASDGKKDIKTDNEEIYVNILNNNIANPGDNEVTNIPSSFIDNTNKDYNNYNYYNNVISNDNLQTNELINDKADSSLEDTFSEDDSNYKVYEKDSEDLVDSTNSKMNRNYLIAFIIILIDILVVIYFIIKNLKNKDDDDKKKKNTTRAFMFVLISVLSLQFFNVVEAAFYDFSKKGEVNGDNKIDYKDVNSIELHLINKVMLANKYLENADINNDSAITVTDLALLVQKLENKLDYEISISEVKQDSEYLEKNTDFYLKFKAIASYDTKVEKVKINNEYYDVILDDIEDNIYKVKVNSSNKAGIKEYKFSEVILNNNKNLEVDFKEKFEVLKTKPVFENYNVKDDFSLSNATISYDLEDSDNAMTSGNVQILDEFGNLVKEYDIKNGRNQFTLEAEINKIYYAKFIINYNLTSKANLEYTGKLDFTKEFEIVGDYKFNIGNYKIYNGINETNTFYKNEEIKISFESSNITKYVPEFIKIYGKNYKLSLENNKYVVIIPGFDKYGDNNIKIESVSLNNGKSFKVNKDLNISIIKKAPNISDFMFEEKENGDIDVKFNIHNDDNALINMIINITDEKDILLKQVKLTSDELKGSKKISKNIKDLTNNSKYKISIVASYLQTNNENDIKNNVILYQNEYLAKFKASILEVKSDKQYYEKGGKALLTYKINTNCPHDVVKLRISNEDYVVTKVGEDLYQVVYNVSTNSGIYDISTSKVVCSNGNVATVSNNVEIEVLKDEVSIQNYKQEYNDSKSKINVSFNLVDKEDSLVEGKIVLLTSDGNIAFSKAITKGKNSFVIDLKSFTSYTLKINALYDRDSKHDDINFINKDLIVKEIEGSTDYNLEVSLLKVIKNNKECKYFEKNEKINLSFESSNARNLDISEVTINGKKYAVNKNDNTYLVVVDGYSKIGEKTLTIEKVKLSNSLEFDIKSNNKVKVEVLKDIPTVSDYNQNIDSTNSKVIMNFNLNDSDNSLVSAEAVLYDKDGKVVSKKTIKKGKNSLEFSIKKLVLYTLKINVSYDRDSKVDNINKVENKTVYEKEIIDNTDYNVTITNFKAIKNNQENKYYEKNEKINLEFESNNTQNLDINEVTINDKKYTVTKNGNTYQAVVDGYTEIGEKTLTIEKIKLVNNIEMDVINNNKTKIEILKSRPLIDNYSVVENINDSSLEILFDLVDDDNSITNSSVKVYDYNNKVVKTVTLKKGANSIKLSVEESKDYKVKFVINYNLSSDDKNTDDNIIGKVNLEKTLRLDINYNFVANNFKIYNENNEESSIFNKGKEIKLVFDSFNATTNTPNKIRINGEEYEVKLENEKYNVLIPGFNSFGSNKINIEKVILSNGKSFDIKQEIDINIIKNVPTISDLSLVDKGERVRVDFSIEDEDKAIVDVEILLLNDKDEIVEQEKISSDEIEAKNITKLYTGVYTSTYKVKIVCNYLLTTNVSDIKENIILSEKEIEATAKVNKISVVSDKKYYEKGSNAILIYDIETNKSDDIKSITINDKNYATSKLDDGRYQITYKLDSSCGVKSLKVSNVTFSNDQVAKVDNNLKVEVLKDSVSVSNFKQTDNSKDSKVTLSFDISDLDDSFISGEAILTNRVDGTKINRSIKKGSNNLEFEVKELEMYDFVIKATYDRDSNTLTNDENVVYEEELFNQEIQLVIDYDLTVSDLATFKNNVSTKYFEKDAEITLLFKSSNTTNFEVNEVTINNKKYKVTKNNDNYQVVVDGYSESGVKKLKIEKIGLSNTKEFNITKNNEIQIEILKTLPLVKNFTYDENVYGDVTVKFDLVDDEDTLSDGKVLIVSGEDAVKEQTLTIGNNTIKFSPKENIDYVLKVVATYDLDSDKLDSNLNEYQDVVLFENEITLGTRQFQVKDIISSTVYTQTSEGVEELDNINVSALSNLDNFIVKVNPKDMSSFYTTIESYRIVDNRLKLTLKYDDIVQYDGNKKINKLEVDAGKVNNGTITDDSLDGLVKKINANPSGNFELTRDYDASFISPNLSTAVFEKFTGTLNGNGHKIINLAKPFFNELEGATIKNIVFNNVKLSGASSHGTIANVATDSTVTNVHIKGLNYTTGANHSAGMIGEATNTNVSECSVSDFVITTAGHVRVSAIIGKLTDGSIRNCYAEGDINSTQSKDGNGIGGVLGHGYGVETVENCITKIKISNNVGARLNGAVVGLFMNKASVLKNNVSLSSGENFYSLYGNGATVTATNNYELADSGLVSNVAALKFATINKNQINSIFYKNEAKFDDTIWDLAGTSYDKLPRLKNADPNGSSTTSSADSGSVYIPDYNRIKKVAGYKKSNEKLYHNIYKLMPYYDAKYLVEDSLKIANDSVLATKMIKHILPYSEGKMLTYVTVENYNIITDIKIIFDDMSVSNYKVNFKELNQNISIYEIEELGIDYAPNSYLMRNDSAIVNILKTYIDGIDYNTTLEPLTEAADARHYRDNFNEVVKGISLDLSLKLLANYEDALTINSEILSNKIKADLIDSGKVNKIIYGYNYFNRWYDFEIGGSKVSDLLLFENKMFKEDNSLNSIVGEVLVGNLAVNSTDGFFNSNVAKYTGSSRLQYFLDYLITNIGGYEDVNDWFTEYFGSRNFLSEFGVDKRPEILYRGWYHLKMMSRMILPVITMPKDSTYMISGPSHLQFGPAQLYNKDTVTAAGKKVVRDTINNHVTLAKRHFTVLAAGFGSLKWNNYCIMVYDCTKIITGYRQGSISIGGITIPTGKIVPVYTQGRVGLNYAFFKNFSEVFGLWQPAGSSGGVGSTAGYLWFQAQPGLTNFDTWTHEFEHALSDKIMLDQRGFRTRMEVMTQGNVEQRDDWSANNLSQDVGPGYFNTSFYLNKEGNATQNLSPDRIDTKEKMENYFKGQQNALDLLDYIEGKAFIRLTPEQQARIATKVVSASERTAWGTITADQATQMNLTTLESLYDNQIILRPLNAWGASVRGLTAPSSTIADNYGYESVWVNRWYIDHYDSHFAGAFGTKRNFFEMLGYAGVEGYIIYGSGSRSAIGDLNVIQRITKLVTGTAMNWREYKLSRYATVEENLMNNKYIDAEYMIQRFTEALVNDANNGDRNVSQRTNLRKIYYHYLKSATNDFVDDPLGSTVEINHIKTAEELVQKINAKPYGYYVLDNDIDFSNMTTNVTQTFMGRLDGNGHKIIGNKFPIFNKIRYGYAGNIVFENTNIPKNLTTAGALSYRSEMSTIEKINVKNLQMNFAGRNDLNLIGGAVSNIVTRDCAVEKLTHHISKADDFATLNEDTGGIFIIDNDIDFTGKTYNGAVVSNIFTGKIDGQGHTLSNLENASFFADFRGTVENLNINNVNINSSGNNVGAFAKQSSAAVLKNMKLRNINLTGASNVGGVIGTDNRGSTFERISVNNLNISSTGMFVGGIVGSQYGGSVANVYVEGEINLSQFGAGGIIGATGNGTAVTINNSIANVGINRTGDTDNQHRKNNAGLVGFIADVSKLSAINNSISFGNMVAFNDEMIPNKFIFTTEDIIKSKLLKCYEVSEAIGGSSVSTNTAGHLDDVTRNNLTIDFYKNLGFNESIWNFDSIASKGYPVLK